MWEAAGISDPKALLISLGFNAEEIHISQLSMAIDDDLQGDEESASTPLLKVCTILTFLLNGPHFFTSSFFKRKASLALHKAEVNALQQTFTQLAAENRNLHKQNRDANRQAGLLAQEVDERHAQLEHSAQTKVHTQRYSYYVC